MDCKICGEERVAGMDMCPTCNNPYVKPLVVDFTATQTFTPIPVKVTRLAPDPVLKNDVPQP